MSPTSPRRNRLLHPFQPMPHRDDSAFTLAYILRLRSCRSMGAVIMSPLPPIIVEKVMNSRVPLLHGSYPASSLLRTRPPPSRLRSISRWMPVIRPTLLRRFLDGTRTASPVAWRILVTVLPLPPPRSESTRRSGFVGPCCLRFDGESSASGVKKFRGHLWVHLRCGPVTRSPPLRWLCQSASDHLVSLLSATQATGLLTSALAGLTPAERASLRWTHSIVIK